MTRYGHILFMMIYGDFFLGYWDDSILKAFLLYMDGPVLVLSEGMFDIVFSFLSFLMLT